ncbi:hypothetical protein CSOJ01_01746 [Colletotrichum sojae]|uniref:Uncharacterized protein n=1 Tax=Colletotrichum sojae TaxID=2175907 RepID=A0A8H6N3X9_9PEZI|nr:hypothetical protein CSOJ01_01746 [Colletotrichum sojae]
MSLNDPSLSKQQRIQVWREEVAASASLCTCPPTSPAASRSSTNISLSASISSGSSAVSPGPSGDAFTFPRGDVLPSQSTYCPTCSRLGAPPAMGLEPLSAAYLDDIQQPLGGSGFDRRSSLMLFRTKTGNHAIFRGMRSLVRRISGSGSSGDNPAKNGPLPPRRAAEATSMYRRVTVAGLGGVAANTTAETQAEADAVADLASDGRGHVPKLIAEKQARLWRAERLLRRSHHNL